MWKSAPIVLVLVTTTACGSDEQLSPWGLGGKGEHGGSNAFSTWKSSQCDYAERAGDELGEVMDSKIFGQLLEMTRSSDSMMRYKAIRMLGKLADREEGSAANQLVHAQAESVTTVLLDRVNVESSPEALSTAIWVLDEFFFPFSPMELRLQALSIGAGQPEVVRRHALRAAGRLIKDKSAIPDADYLYILSLLRSSDHLQQYYAAFTCRAIVARTSEPWRGKIVAALKSVMLKPASPVVERAIARTLRKYDPNASGVTSSEYVRPSQLVAVESFDAPKGSYRVVVRAATPETAKRFGHLMQLTAATFSRILGPSFESPVDSPSELTVNIFPNRETYSDFKKRNAFHVGDGFFDPEENVIVTFDKPYSENALSVESMLQHEMTHYLQGLFLFPLADYRTKRFPLPFWAIEGMADYFGGLQLTDNHYFAPHKARLEDICPRPRRNLAVLLSEANPFTYPQPGECGNRIIGVAYADVWSLAAFLFQTQPAAVQSIYQAYRNGQTLSVSDIAIMTGAPSIEALEEYWHSTIDSWCEQAGFATIG